MRKTLDQVRFNTRQVNTVLRLAIAHREAVKYASNLQISLYSENCIFTKKLVFRQIVATKTCLAIMV